MRDQGGPMNAVYSSRTFGGDKRRAWEAVVSQLYASMDVQVRGVPEFEGEITHCLLDDLDLTHVIADYEIASRRRRHIARDVRQSCVFLFVKKGPMTLEQFGREALLDANSCSPSLAQAATRRRALAYIDRRISDAALDPAMVAAAIGVSTRYLHRVFESSENSVSTHIRAKRLESARADLADEKMCQRSISEIALRNGFANQSSFATSFKR